MRNPVRKILVSSAVSIAAFGAAMRLRPEADFAGKVVLITGGSRGLGLALARELANHGCTLAICARDEAELARAAEDVRAHGAEVRTWLCDVSDQMAVEKMVQEVTEAFGQVDLLVTNAGEIIVGPVTSFGAQDYEHAMDVMFYGTLYPILAVIPQMRERQAGQIATITSIGGRIAVPHLSTYSAAKFAAYGLSSGLAAELAREGIAVTSVVPGLMRTGSHIRAVFKGDDSQRRGDYAWFSLAAGTPMVPRADHAARTIIRAIRRRQTTCTFSLPFVLMERFAGIAPATTIRLAQVADRLLPNVPSPVDAPQQAGAELEATATSPLHRLMKGAREAAVRDFNP